MFGLTFEVPPEEASGKDEMTLERKPRRSKDREESDRRMDEAFAEFDAERSAESGIGRDDAETDPSRDDSTESYEAFRIRMQAEDPNPDLCEHAMPLRIRCIRCEDDNPYGRFGEGSGVQ